MKRLTFLQSLLVLPFISLSSLAASNKGNRSEYQKCYDRIASAAFAEGITPKELDWFVKELLKVEPKGDLAGNFGRTFIVRLHLYLKDSYSIKYDEFGFIGQMRLLAILRADYPEVFSDQELRKFCPTLYCSKLDQLLKNICLKVENTALLDELAGERF